MRKLALPMFFCLAVVGGALTLSATEAPPVAPATVHAEGQEATPVTSTQVSPQPLPAFLLPVAPDAGCTESLLTNPKPLSLSCLACTRRLDCPPCPGCVKDCDGFGCCVCYCK